jgi:two-component system, cell cycle response regulator
MRDIGESAESKLGLSRSAARWVLAAEAISVLGLAGYAAYLWIHDPADGPTIAFDRVLYCALIVFPGLICIARAWLVRRERAAWLLLGLSLVVWGIGESYWAAISADDPNAPYPGPDDAIILLSYPLALAGMALLLRDRVRRFRRETWLDGLIGALTVGAFGAAFLLPDVLSSLEGPPLADAFSVGYPLADIVQLGFLLCVLVLVGWRLDLSWLLVAASFAILPIADALVTYQDLNETYVEGGFVDLLFPASAVLLGLAAWRPATRETATGVRSWRSLATPAMFALASGGLLLYGYAGGLPTVAVVFAGAALFAATLRLAHTYYDNQRLFERAQTDDLTGLGNRSALLLDLAELLEENGNQDPRVLVMLDLNGFKHYNDTFGHPAGDALLVRLAGRFAAVVEPNGRAYRIGGDEFCALLECPRSELQRLVSRSAAALAESGEAFEVGAARGHVELGTEAGDPHDALQIADRRMYEDKAGSRSSARSQAHEVLLRMLRERQPELGDHVDSVAHLAIAVSERLGLEGEDLDVVGRAAALHDIGKLAIPDAVLDKPAPLDDEEWAFIRDHTVVGERVLREAPALTPVAELVRSSHERWDGSGYPDALEGERIPLGARIIFVCDAFQAMLSDRPYAAPVATEDALGELKRCAGTQFDPAVVEAFVAEVRARPTGWLHAQPAPVAG